MVKYVFDIRTNALLGAGEAEAEHVRAKAREYFDLIETCQLP